MIKNVFNSHLIFQHQIVFIMFLKEMNEYFLGFNLIIWYTILQILHFFLSTAISLWVPEIHEEFFIIMMIWIVWQVIWYIYKCKQKQFNYKYRFRSGLFLEGGKKRATFFLPPPPWIYPLARLLSDFWKNSDLKCA